MRIACSPEIFEELTPVRHLYETEIHRIIIHGVLHLCGINDKTPEEREVMTQNEDEALRLLETL